MTGRVLIHRPGSLGDTVIALPCLRLIRGRFPDSELRVLTNAPVADSAPPLFAVLDGSGLIDGYLEYPIGLRNLPLLWRLAREIRRWRPDVLIYLARRETKLQVWRDAAFFRVCGIRNVVGLALTWDQIRSRALADDTFERESERLVRNVAALGSVDLSDPASWDLGLTEADRALPRRLIAERIGAQPFIVLSIGTKQPTNDWGLANWRALTEQLSRIYPHRLVFIGAEGDRERSEAIARGLADRCVNLCGLLKVRESAALIAEASLFIGSDSGPMHLAAAVGTPLVAIFSRLNLPGIWFPSARQAKILYPYEPWTTVQAITLPMVLEAAQGLLPAGVAARKLAGGFMIPRRVAAEAPAATPAPRLDAVHRVREVALIAVLAWAPLPFGSARPWAWDLLGIVALLLLALSAAYETTRPSRQGVLQPLLPALIAGGLVAAWIVFQSLPWDVLGWHHPLWDRASEVAGRRLDASLSIDREASLVHLFRLLTYAAYCVIAWQIARRPEAAGRILRAIAVIGTVYALYGLGEFIAPDPRILWFVKETYVTDVTSTFVNRNSYATFAGLGVIAHLVLIADILNKKTDLRSRRSFLLSLADSLLGHAKWLVLGLIVCSGSLLMSHSRGGLISALSAILVLMVLILAAPATRAPWRYWFAGFVGVGCVAIVLLTGASTFDRLDAMSSDAEMRPKINETVLRAIGDNWMTGTGYGSFADIFPLYQPLSVVGFVDLAHDDYLENALELGVPAAALLFGAVLYLGGRCLVGVFRRRRDVIYPLAGAAATVLVGVHSALDFSMQIPAVAVTYAVILGVGVAQSVGTRDPAKKAGDAS